MGKVPGKEVCVDLFIGVVIRKQRPSNEGVRDLVDGHQRESTAHSFCGKLLTGWDENEKIIIIIVVGKG